MRTRKRIITWRSPSFVLLLVLALLAAFSSKQEAASAVVITEFSDFQCPYCKQAAGVVEQLRARYGERLKVVFKQMPLPMHPMAFKAAQASVCAGEKGKFWQYHDRLFQAKDLSVAALKRMAAETGLQTDEFTQCLDAEHSRVAVQQNLREADRLGVSGTPTFFIEGQLIHGATSFAALSQKIDQEMLKLDHVRGLRTGPSKEIDIYRAAAARESNLGAPALDMMSVNAQPVNAALSQSQCSAFVPPPLPNCAATIGGAADVLSLLPANPSTGINCSVQFTAVFSTGQGAAQQQCDTTPQIQQWVSSNPAVATIDTTGKAVALSLGSTTITATERGQQASTTLTISTSPTATPTPTPTPSPTATATPTPTPTPLPSSQPGLSLSAGALSFADEVVGTTSSPQVETLTFQGIGAGGTGVTFNSIALSGMNASDFLVQSDACSGHTLYFGVCQVTIAFRPSGPGTRSANVIINDNLGGAAPTFSLTGNGLALALTSLMISPSSPTVISGSQVQFNALGTYNDGTQKDVTSQAQWSSSRHRVATVDQGLATGIRAGNAVITASIGDVLGHAHLAVDYQVSFLVEPSTTPVSREISPAVRVQVRDNGHPVQDLRVKLALAPDAPNPAKLTGVRSDEEQDGVVMFEDLKLDYWGNGYRLVASVPRPGGGASSATSAPFDETRVGDPCLGPNPSCSSGCPDADGDGLNDAWEKAGGIDLNGDGKISAKYDLLLPAADPNKPDIYVWYDWMDFGMDDWSCTTDSQCHALGGYHRGETCSSQGECVYACNTDSDCISRFPTAAHTGERCTSNVCEHTHDPLVLDGANAFQPVVDRFAAHGINLHVMRGHAQPHSHVVSYRQSNQLDLQCEGGSLAAGTAGPGKYAVSLYDLKASSIPDKQKIAYHYALFGHYVGCDTAAHCTPMALGGTGDCPFAVNPDRTPKNLPAQGSSGLAEVVGNDFVVSLGGLVNDQAFLPHFILQITFMHELGHNLGLRHDGHMDYACSTTGQPCLGTDTCTDTRDGQGQVCHQITGGVTGAEEPNYKPNYLSIMNYMYEANGILVGRAVGSGTVLSCTADSDCGGDGGMCIGGGCRRLDYSRQVLPAGGNTPGMLVENNLNAVAGLGSGTADLFFFKNGRCSVSWQIAPTTGPVDWSGTGDLTLTSVTADIDAKVGTGTCVESPSDKLTGHADWPDISGIPFQYNFQCRSTGGD